MTILGIFMALLGAVLGSFFGLLAHRWPVGRADLFGRSRCDACGRTLTAIDLVPLVSWLALGGRCRRCGAPVSGFFAVVEAAAAAVGAAGVAIAEVRGLGAAGLAATAIFGWALVALAAIDWRHTLLPDALTLPLLAAGLAYQGLWGPLGLPLSAATAAVAGIGLYGLAEGYWRLRGREGLGLGDVKLLAAGGAWLGPFGLSLALLIGSLAGLAFIAALAVRGRLRLSATTQIPFGPFLALGLWVAYALGPAPLAGPVAGVA
ncbi:prepilin peptidase [Rhodothalassium salexigens]|uniref:prepilin peptidase n=1 Tax=Rhodothalassium salexigens TaxID=1086 RepID=UPI0019113DDD